MYIYNNDDENTPREIEVNISLTLSKTVKVKVDDYEIMDSGVDEDGIVFEDVDYSQCDLNTAVRDQIVLPNDAWRYINDDTKQQIVKDLKDWEVEELWVESNE